MAGPLLDRLRDRSVFLSTLNYQIGQLLYRCGLRRHRSGATLDRLDAGGSLEYVRRVFDNYLRYGGLQTSDLAGKRVLEVGPGDNLGVALLFAAHGAKQVVCLERFQDSGATEKNRQLYRALLDGLESDQRRRADACLDESGAFRPTQIDCRYGFPIETAHNHLPNGGFDLIVSRAVLEHVYDVEGAWKSMDRLLAPGGRMLHKIDFRCHGFYQTLHPLWWLTVPDWLWNTVSSPDPTLNRARRPVYARLAGEFGYSCQIRITHLASRQEELVPHLDRLDPDAAVRADELALIERIRPRLAAPFHGMATEDLLINGIFLSAVKP